MNFFLPLLLCLTSTTTQASTLGRLFFTPQQRTQLETPATPPTARQGTEAEMVINGIVQKQGGQRTVWINGKPQAAGKSDERAPDSLSVTVPGKSQPVKAKVGQKIFIKKSVSDGAEDKGN